MQSIQLLQTRERFLPLKLPALLERMIADPRLSGTQRDQFRALAEMLAARFHFEFHRRAEDLKTLYEPFDPDCDTRMLRTLGPAERESQCGRLIEGFRALLEKANYVELPRGTIARCIELQTRSGLTIRASLDDYRDLRIFYRGVRREQRSVRRWWKWWRPRPEDVNVVSRVAMLVRPARQAEDHVLLKLFKNVVAEDLEMVLPQVRIQMRWMDRVKIGSSMAGSLITAAWKAFTAAFLSPVIFLLVLVGLTSAAVKGILSFLASKTRYMQALTANLYFQNLANNSSAIGLLVDAAEAEEVKEILLAYFILYVERQQDYTLQQLDRRIEAWLGEQFGLRVDFDVADGVEKLIDKRLAVRRAPGATAGLSGRAASEESAVAAEVLKVYDLPSALRRLDQTWDDLFTAARDRAAVQDRLADRDGTPAERAAALAETETDGARRRFDAPQAASGLPAGVQVDKPAVAPER